MIQKNWAEEYDLRKVYKAWGKLENKVGIERIAEIRNDNLQYIFMFKEHLKAVQPLISARISEEELATITPLLAFVTDEVVFQCVPLCSRIEAEASILPIIEGEDCMYFGVRAIEIFIEKNFVRIEREVNTKKALIRRMVFHYLLWLTEKKVILVDKNGIIGGWKAEHESFVDNFKKEFDKMINLNHRENEV